VDRGQRERGSGGGSPLVGVTLNLQMSETRILIRLLRMYFPRNWEFGSALSKLWNFGGWGFEPPQTTPLGTPLAKCNCTEMYKVILVTVNKWIHKHISGAAYVSYRSRVTAFLYHPYLTELSFLRGKNFAHISTIVEEGRGGVPAVTPG
jgi:hypothetical protein